MTLKRHILAKAVQADYPIPCNRESYLEAEFARNTLHPYSLTFIYAMGRSAVYACGISCSNSLTFLFGNFKKKKTRKCGAVLLWRYETRLHITRKDEQDRPHWLTKRAQTMYFVFAVEKYIRNRGAVFVSAQSNRHIHLHREKMGWGTHKGNHDATILNILKEVLVWKGDRYENVCSLCSATVSWLYSFESMWNLTSSYATVRNRSNFKGWSHLHLLNDKHTDTH